MKKEKTAGIIGGLIAVIIIGIVIAQFYSIDETNPDNTKPPIVDVDGDGVPDEEDPLILAPRVWQTSGSFQIDKEKYLLGELVLIRIGDLKSNEKGQIAFLRPHNGTHYPVYITIPFDGSEKETFNQYFKPALSISTKTCSIDDLIGNWTVVFRDTNGQKLYENLKFEIINETIPGDEEHYKSIC